jgi:hypothetical protein
VRGNGQVNLGEVDMKVVYGVVGFLIVTNLGTMGTLIVTFIKLSFKAGELVSKVNKMEKDLNSLGRIVRESRVK